MSQAQVLRRSQGRGGKRGKAVVSSRSFTERNCSLARTVDILSDSWAFLILRECYFGARRFQEFQSALGMPRPTLSQRLRKLTAQGLLRRVQYSDVPNRSEYKLTEKGIDMYPVMLALLAFGDKWLVQSGKPPIYLV